MSKQDRIDPRNHTEGDAPYTTLTREELLEEIADESHDLKYLLDVYQRNHHDLDYVFTPLAALLAKITERADHLRHTSRRYWSGAPDSMNQITRENQEFFEKFLDSELPQTPTP